MMVAITEDEVYLARQNQSLLRENRRLRAENEQLVAEVDRLRARKRSLLESRWARYERRKRSGR